MSRNFLSCPIASSVPFRHNDTFTRVCLFHYLLKSLQPSRHVYCWASSLSLVLYTHIFSSRVYFHSLCIFFSSSFEQWNKRKHYLKKRKKENNNNDDNKDEKQVKMGWNGKSWRIDWVWKNMFEVFFLLWLLTVCLCVCFFIYIDFLWFEILPSILIEIGCSCPFFLST